MPLDHRIDDDLADDERRLIQDGLVAFGDVHAPPRNDRGAEFVVLEDGSRVVAGLFGSIVWDWLQVDVLWVRDDRRGQGIGRSLLAHAERTAHEAGCRHARLDTFDFEARDFEERAGSEVYAELRDFPSGHSQFHLRTSWAD